MSWRGETAARGGYMMPSRCPAFKLPVYSTPLIGRQYFRRVRQELASCAEYVRNDWAPGRESRGAS